MATRNASMPAGQTSYASKSNIFSAFRFHVPEDAPFNENALVMGAVQCDAPCSCYDIQVNFLLCGSKRVFRHASP